MATCADIYSYLMGRWASAGDFYGWADGFNTVAYHEMVADNLPDAILNLTWAMDSVIKAGQRTISEHYPSMDEFALLYYAKNCTGGGGEITMADLINVMLTANPDQVEYFIGLVDAYRQSIWNRPFNHEFFTALGRGFMEWE